jgi:tetratricopeptide (TPR) repeat protein
VTRVDGDIVFFPASPRHPRMFDAVARRLGDRRIIAIDAQDYRPEEHGLRAAIEASGLRSLRIASPDEAAALDFTGVTALVMYAGDDALATALAFAARRDGGALIGIEEGNQLALNANALNFYGLPYTALLVASPDERRRLVDCGHAPDAVEVVGLTIYDEAQRDLPRDDDARAQLGITPDAFALVYASSPLQRIAPHSLDTLEHRLDVVRTMRDAADRLLALDVQRIVKLHPFEDPAAARGPIHDVDPDAIVLGGETSVDVLLGACDAVLNRGNSQVALEAIWRGRPVIVMPRGIETIFTAQGGACIADDAEALARALTAIHAGDTPDPSAIFEHHSAPEVGDRTSRRIAEIVTAQPRRAFTDDEAFTFGILLLEKRQRTLARAALRSAGCDLDAIDWTTLAERTTLVQCWIEAARAACDAEQPAAAFEALDRAQSGRWLLRHERPHLLDLIRAGVHRRFGELDAAIALYDDVLTARPEYAQVRYQRAVTLGMAGRDDEARAALAQLATDSPHFQPARNALTGLDEQTRQALVDSLF